MGDEREAGIYKTFVLSLGLTFVLSLSAIFVVVSISNRELIYEQALAQARAHFSSIVLTRKWNANYGGVYVEKKADMTSNPYLENPDITTVDGKTFTKKHPALMTREISEYFEKEGLLKFHITSLNLLNPDNKPDEFEIRALGLFEKGEKEYYENIKRNNATYFRYMAPLYIEKECLQCHAKQGYKTGDVRGGISVTFNIKRIQNIQDRNTLVIISFAIISIAFILGLAGFFTLRLIRKISDARRKIEMMAVTDELTGIHNRRYVLERFSEEFGRARRLGTDLGCIMVDIDNFKSINDQYGHLIGDKILKETAECIERSLRTYDVLGRYGGEEFIIVLPDTNFQDALGLSERIRQNVRTHWKGHTTVVEGRNVTISIGVTSLNGRDTSIDDVIKRADDNLYKAKSAGRDTVESSR